MAAVDARGKRLRRRLEESDAERRLETSSEVDG